ncbi:MAG: hypothetical protein GOU98_00080 [Candidatus Altiarchaeota archaeon]|nr:hypothetical protein [Candidatus Altiarchaeota archaeon]
MDLKDLSKFLVEAKRAGYAKLGDLTQIKLSDGGSQYKFYKDNFIYLDTYYGFNPFQGTEVVLFDNKPMWGMSYRGKLINGDSDKVYDFLKKALQKVPLGGPFRGPRSFGDGSYEYMNEFEGDISEFKGTEKIMVDDVLAYELEYMGGKIRRKVV